jgi:hypothetical protein
MKNGNQRGQRQTPHHHGVPALNSDDNSPTINHLGDGAVANIRFSSPDR